jgi:hypothetical protein
MRIICMRTIVAVAVMAVLVSIVAVSTLAVPGNIDARTRGSDSDSVAPVSSDGGSGIYTTVCGPDAAHACQTAS